jgi:hypothetical protein
MLRTIVTSGLLVATGLLLSLQWCQAQEPGRPSSATDKNKYHLKWKLQVGDTFYGIQDTTMDQSMSLMGQNIDMKMKTQAVIRFRVKEVDDKGAVVEMTILKQKMNMEGPQGFPGLDIGDKLSKVTFTLKLNKKMEVVKVEGFDNFMEALGQEDPMMVALLRSMFPESVVRQSFSQFFAFAPDEPLAIGDVWNHKDKMPLGPLGNMEILSRYKLQEVSDGVARLALTADLKWAGSDNKMPQLLPFKITDVDIKSDKFTGTLHFDIDKGRLQKLVSEAQIKGSLEADVMNQKLNLDINQKVKTVITIEDKNPVKD